MGWYAVNHANSSCFDLLFSTTIMDLPCTTAPFYCARRIAYRLGQSKYPSFLKELNNLKIEVPISMKRFASFEVKDMTF